MRAKLFILALSVMALPALAQSTLRFHERYQSDFLKVTPNGGYARAGRSEE